MSAIDCHSCKVSMGSSPSGDFHDPSCPKYTKSTLPDDQEKVAHALVVTQREAYYRGRRDERAEIIRELDCPPAEYHRAVGNGWPVGANDATEWWHGYLIQGAK